MPDVLKHRILLVDDEVAITKSLYRLFKNEGYHIDICNSGFEGVKVLKAATEPFSLIISDQRMPEMSGSEFLEKAEAIAPEAIRFILTGYSDLQAVIDAINKGKIHRYLTKPWNNDALLLHVRQALRDVEMRRENERLNQVTKRQNRQLYELGVSLEKKCKERTHAVKESNEKLLSLNRALEESFSGTIQMMLALVEVTNRPMGGYLRHTGRLSRKVAIEMGLPERDVATIEIAGQLHDIGLFGLPDHLLSAYENDLAGDELKRYRQHPVFAAISLERIQRLSGVCDMVLHHHENYDGTGFPNGFKGEMIPLGARIIGTVSDYCRVVDCWPKERQAIRKKLKDSHGISLDAPADMKTNQLLRTVAEKILLGGINKRYDSLVVSAIISVLRKETEAVLEKKSGAMALDDLRPGMVVPQDLVLKDGRLILSQSTTLDVKSIAALQRFGQLKMIPEKITIVSEDM